MAIAKKGFRKIEVEGEKYAWKFNGKVFVAKERNNRSTLIIDFGWFDGWLFANDRENRPPDFYPRVATPKFVSESIQFAIEQGWGGGNMEIEFRNGEYKKIKT